MIGKIPSIQSSSMQAIDPAQAISRKSAGETSGGNPFSSGTGLLAGNTSGIANPNLKGKMYLGDGAIGGAELNLIG